MAARSGWQCLQSEAGLTVHDAVFRLLRDFGMTTIWQPGSTGCRCSAFSGTSATCSARNRSRSPWPTALPRQPAMPLWSISIRRLAPATRSAICSPPFAIARRSSSSPASRRARSCPIIRFFTPSRRPNSPNPMSNGAASRRAPRTCPRRSRGPGISPCRPWALLRLGAGRRWDRPMRTARGARRVSRGCAATRACSPTRRGTRRSRAAGHRRRAGRRATMRTRRSRLPSHAMPVWVSPLSSRNSFPEPSALRQLPRRRSRADRRRPRRARPHPRRRRAGLHLSCRGASGRTSPTAPTCSS